MNDRPSVAEQDEILLLVDDDFTVRTAMAAALERRGRRIITCADLESAQTLLDTMPINAAIADVRLSGAFGCEGLDLIKYVIDAHPGTRVVLISGHTTQELHREATARGAVALLQKPFCIDAIEEAIGSGTDERGVDVSRTIEMPSLDSLLADRRLFNAFQPIVAADGSLFGYESLARIDNDAPLNDPGLLFRYAERKRRLSEVELACIQTTFRNITTLPEQARIFINIHPHALTLGEGFTDAVLGHAQTYGIPLERVVFEITEQASLGKDARTTLAIEALRKSGATFAFDDVGVAYSHYTELQRVKPSFLKISHLFGTGFEGDSYRTKIVRNITSLARDFAIDVILEGVESEDTAKAARMMGIRFMQGYYFGRPVEASRPPAVN
jgi:EAL domain-containing protein (putative c-di-GMP-specific phosphodiesterase class I)